MGDTGLPLVRRRLRLPERLACESRGNRLQARLARHVRVDESIDFLEILRHHQRRRLVAEPPFRRGEHRARLLPTPRRYAKITGDVVERSKNSWPDCVIAQRALHPAEL